MFRITFGVDFRGMTKLILVSVDAKHREESSAFLFLQRLIEPPELKTTNV